ncbi:MAG: hypothetical protein HQ494_06240 [Rhodospirillales bacterium]|nr:hypothetical protein [Rhodospirillales bacterium]
MAIVSVLGLAAGCQHAAPEQPLSLVLPLVGDSVSESFTVAGKNIPLPSGDWIVIGSQITKDGTRGYHSAHMLAQIEGNTLHSAIEVYTKSSD